MPSQPISSSSVRYSQNSYVFLGLLLNVVVLVGLALMKQEQRRVYRLNVAALTVIDICFALMEALCMPGIEFKNKLTFVVTGSITLLNSPPLSRYAYILFTITYNCCFILQPLSFLQRYFAICRPNLGKYKFRKPLFVFASLFTVLYSIPPIYILFKVVKSEQNPYEKDESQESIIRRAHFVSYADMPEAMATVRWFCIFAALILMVAAMVFSSVKIFLHLKKFKNSFTKKTLNAQRRLTVVLILQALVPVVTCVIPMYLCMYLYYEKDTSNMMTWYIVLINAWQPTLSALINLCFISPIRRALTGVFRCYRTSTTVQASVQIQNTTVQCQ